ncbi:hypothetical protein tb265_02220 [Gemmatimonadetes bacterium T265]|nr:hypothetical protein tb265_02220 [Gemmatimonadetes bacterium T265]
MTPRPVTPRPVTPYRTTPRRGFALPAALWLVVAISAAALAFATEARAHRALALGAAGRGAERAAAEGALAVVRGRLEQVLRDRRVTGAGAATLRAADPWLDADTLFADTLRVAGVPVHVAVRDLGAMLPVNAATEDDLRNCFGAALDDYAAADHLAQAIADWIDADSVARAAGGERDAYLAAGRLVLPPNRPARDVDELRDVLGMTPQTFATLRPLLTTIGSGRVNVNTAPPAVLRGVPGLTDDVVARILAVRAAHQRVTSVAGLFGAGGDAGRRGAALRGQLASRLAYDVEDLEVSVTVLGQTVPRGATTHPTLRAVIERSHGVVWESR